MADEREDAIKLANKILDRPGSADPDDDIAVLSRQLLRAIERELKPTPDEAMGKLPLCPRCRGSITEAGKLGNGHTTFKMPDRSAHIIQLIWCKFCGETIGMYLVGIQPPSMILGGR